MNDLLSKVVEIIESKLGEKPNILDATFFLKTPSGWVEFGMEENDSREKQVKFHIHGGKAVFVETNEDFLSHLFENSEEEDNQ